MKGDLFGTQDALVAKCIFIESVKAFRCCFGALIGAITCTFLSLGDPLSKKGDEPKPSGSKKDFFHKLTEDPCQHLPSIFSGSQGGGGATEAWTVGWRRGNRGMDWHNSTPAPCDATNVPQQETGAER